uniref:Transposase n=1 Tax=Heterorhabditis bacteriophora TaxID=37862 RepID=A0A1I7XEM4_HETBA
MTCMHAHTTFGFNIAKGVATRFLATGNIDNPQSKRYGLVGDDRKRIHENRTCTE